MAMPKTAAMRNCAAGDGGAGLEGITLSVVLAWSLDWNGCS